MFRVIKIHWIAINSKRVLKLKHHQVYNLILLLEASIVDAGIRQEIPGSETEVMLSKSSLSISLCALIPLTSKSLGDLHNVCQMEAKLSSHWALAASSQQAYSAVKVTCFCTNTGGWLENSSAQGLVVLANPARPVWVRGLQGVQLLADAFLLGVGVHPDSWASIGCGVESIHSSRKIM